MSPKSFGPVAVQLFFVKGKFQCHTLSLFCLQNVSILLKILDSYQAQNSSFLLSYAGNSILQVLFLYNVRRQQEFFSFSVMHSLNEGRKWIVYFLQ